MSGLDAIRHRGFLQDFYGTVPGVPEIAMTLNLAARLILQENGGHPESQVHCLSNKLGILRPRLLMV